MDFEANYNENKSIRIGDSISGGWEAMKQNYFGCLGVGLVSGILNYAFDIALLSFILSGPVAAGSSYFAVQLVRGNSSFGQMFAGFSKFFTSFALYILLTIMIFVAVFPVAMIFGVLVGSAAALDQPSGFVILAGILLMIPCTVIILALCARLYFAFPLCIDQKLGPIASIQTSWVQTRGNTIRLTLLALVLTLIGAACVVALVLPLFFVFLPLSYGVLSVVYDKLFSQASEHIASTFE